jgi:peptidoglycan-associated lipoprotein
MHGWVKTMKHRLVLFLTILAILTGASCRKRVASAPPPPQPEPPVSAPAPTASIIADRTTIAAGENVTLRWQTENAARVEIGGLGEVDVLGSVQVSPDISTSYNLTATGPGGSATDVVRITVNPRRVEQPEISSRVPTLEEDFLAKIEDVLFDYDRSTLRADQLTKVDALATWLREHPGTRVVIEGHCDERGNTEYNLGLGDRRASAVRERLENSGVARGRLEIISYGEERPTCSEQNESCWSRNRRAHFVLEPTS